MKKFSAILCVLFVIIMVFALPVSAAAPYQTYTYSISGTALNSPGAYDPDTTVDAKYIGLLDEKVMSALYPDLSREELAKKMVPFEDASDIETDEFGNVYIADTKNNRILALDRNYKLKFIIDSFYNDLGGGMDSLSGPKGVFITKDKIVEGKKVEGKIYVCDTENSRIVTFDRNGNYLSVIGAPESEIIESGEVYKPVAVAVDKYDRLYVISSTTYQGVIVMTDEGIFTQYIGAQKVVISAWEIIWRRFQTDEQRELSEEFLSVEFNNIAINDQGHIYVTTSAIEEGEMESAILGKDKSDEFAPVKLLNAAGDEIMNRNGFYPPSGEIDIGVAGPGQTISGVSTIVDVAVGPEQIWSIIDNKRSRVFTYDTQGNLLFAFGDTGQQLGNLTSTGLVGIAYQGRNMLLLDQASKSFTVYTLTPYGNVLVNALHNTNQRQYDKAVEDWREILKSNSNFDAAYIGIGNALYRSGSYDEAIEYYKAAYDTANYSNAYKEIRKEWISKYILLWLQ